MSLLVMVIGVSRDPERAYLALHSTPSDNADVRLSDTEYQTSVDSNLIHDVKEREAARMALLAARHLMYRGSFALESMLVVSLFLSLLCFLFFKRLVRHLLFPAIDFNRHKFLETFKAYPHIMDYVCIGALPRYTLFGCCTAAASVLIFIRFEMIAPYERSWLNFCVTTGLLQFFLYALFFACSKLYLDIRLYRSASYYDPRRQYIEA